MKTFPSLLCVGVSVGVGWGVGSICTSHPAAPGSILRVPECFSWGNFLGKINFDVAEIYWQPCLEASGQRPDNVKRTHLVLASGKLVLQKTFPGLLWPWTHLKQPRHSFKHLEMQSTKQAKILTTTNKHGSGSSKVVERTHHSQLIMGSNLPCKLGFCLLS